MSLRHLTNLKKLPKSLSNKQQAKKVKQQYEDEYRHLDLDLSIKLGKQYAGSVSDTIIGVINDLPAPIKQILNNESIKSMVNRQGYAMIVLTNKITIKIADVKVHYKPKKLITIKQGKNIIVNTLI
jgi:hypothetical protein